MATRLGPAHFARIFRELRDGITNEELFAPTLTLHTLSGSSATDMQESNEQAMGWDLVVGLIERFQQSYRTECRKEEPPADCRWHVGIDYLGEPLCDARCCASSEPNRPHTPFLTRVCFDEKLRANALTISELR